MSLFPGQCRWQVCTGPLVLSGWTGTLWSPTPTLSCQTTSGRQERTGTGAPATVPANQTLQVHYQDDKKDIKKPMAVSFVSPVSFCCPLTALPGGSKFLNVYDFGLNLYIVHDTPLSQSQLFLLENLSCDWLRLSTVLKICIFVRPYQPLYPY